MKKVLAALLVLALVAPTFAVSFSGSDLGGGKARISFDVPAGEVLRGVALKLTTTAGTATIADTAAVTAIDSFFDVFIDYAFEFPGGFTVTPRVGHPLADPAAAGVLDAFPASEFSLSMGVLDETGAQGGATGTGVLCEIQYALTGASATIHVEADTLRGGAVVGDAVTQPTAFDIVLSGQCNVSKPTLSKTTAAPAIATRVNSGRVETFVASASSDQSHVLEYQFDWGDGSALVWGAATQTHVYTYTAAATYNVVVTARCTVDGATNVSDPLAVTTEEFSSSIDSVAYAAWASFGRKPCWAYNRNCRGDANGRKVGLYAVTSHDLNALKAAYTKQDSVLQTISYDPDGTGTLPAIPGICTDFNKTKVGLYRVTSTDLTLLKTYYTKQDSAVPVCPLGAGDGHGIIYYTVP